MIIAGAKGFAKEVLQLIADDYPSSLDTIAFFDNVNEDSPYKLYDKFPVLTSWTMVQIFFNKTSDRNFILGVGNTTVRYNLCEEFERLGGLLQGSISKKSNIGSFNVKLHDSVQIMQGTTITNDVQINKGTLVNLHCTIGHDSKIGSFCELSPSVNISGRCVIENKVSIGTGAIILPDITIGKNAIIGAGAVVTSDVPANVIAVGIPAKVIKSIH